MLVDLLIITRKVPVSCIFISFQRLSSFDLVYSLLTGRSQHLFAPYYTRFLVRSDDLTQVKKDKIRLLLNVLNTDNYAAIMREFIVSVLYYKSF